MRVITALITTASLMLLSPLALADDEYVELAEVPDPARDTIEREVADGQILKVERGRDDGRVTYEVYFQQDGQRYELLVAEDGTLLKRELD